jgi:MoxR-like ATPase
VDINLEKAQQLAAKITQNMEKVMVGKPDAVQLAVIALISRGHLLIEDAPGVGKTMLARSLAKLIAPSSVSSLHLICCRVISPA